MPSNLYGLSGGGTLVVSGTPNTAAQFGVGGELESSDITTTELGYLDGVTSNVQDQIDDVIADYIAADAVVTAAFQAADALIQADVDAITTLANGKIYIGDASNEISEVTVTGDIAISNLGVASITADSIVDADINSAAAISRSKIAAGTADKIVITNGSGILTESTVDASKLAYLDTVTARATINLNDNQVAPAAILTFDTATYRHVEIQYSLSRSSANVATGKILLVHDGSSAAINNQTVELGSPGVTITADISGSDMRLLYTSTNTGQAPTFKYKVEQWI